MNTSTGNALLSRLGVHLPIVQAPMAGVSSPAMAAAVSNAGGLGSLGLGAMNAERARTAIQQTRALTDKPINVNVFCHTPATPNVVVERAWIEYLAPEFAKLGTKPPEVLREIYTSFVADEAMFRMLLAEKPAVLSFHFGLPAQAWIEELHAAGIYLLAAATNLHEAEQIVEAGIDAVIAQGIEAGGHRGTFNTAERDEGLGTFALVRLIASTMPVPVIAAGGIMDGAGIAAALALGAQAAQLGTAFVSTAESLADTAYRDALLSGKPIRTAFTKSISGRNARGIINRLITLGEAPNCPATPDYPVTYDAGKALHAAAAAKGSSEYAAQWAGQAAQLSRGIPAAQLVEALATELDDVAHNLRDRW